MGIYKKRVLHQYHGAFNNFNCEKQNDTKKEEKVQSNTYNDDTNNNNITKHS